MNFDFSDDQKFLKEQARKFLGEQCPPATVREVLETDEPYHKGLWAKIGEMGWAGAAIPEEYGGLGLGHLELCVIAEEMGRAVAPVPFSSTVYLAAEALMMAGTEDQKRAWLPKIAAGEAIGCFATAEGAGTLRPESVGTRFVNGVLNGCKMPVADGDVADLAVVLATADVPGSEDSVQWVLVDMSADGVKKETVKTLDPTRSHASLSFTDVKAEPLGAVGDGWGLTRRLQDRAAVLFAFEQVGGADACLEMAKDYAMNRYAFGRQIASFQAIKHKLADMYIANELARSNAFYGAWALSTDAVELPTAAAGARVSAIQAYQYAAKENIQTHGGMGFTWEFDCHLHLRRSKLLALAIGSERQWKDRLVGNLERKNVA